MTVPDLKEAVESKLVWNWRAVLQKAWSIRINLFLAVSSAADAGISYAVDGRYWTSAVVAVVSLIACASRIVAQRGLDA